MEIRKPVGATDPCISIIGGGDIRGRRKQADQAEDKTLIPGCVEAYVGSSNHCTLRSHDVSHLVCLVSGSMVAASQETIFDSPASAVLRLSEQGIDPFLVGGVFVGSKSKSGGDGHGIQFSCNFNQDPNLGPM